MECLKQQVPHLYRSLGGKRVAEAYEDYEGDFFENTVYCHEAAHVFGETIYAETKDITDAFAICPQACKGGCAHGAVAAMSVETPLDRLAFKYLAELCRESGRDRGDYMVCLHGLGHTMMLVRDYELLDALKDCEELKLDDVSTTPCWTGVFMENARGIGFGHDDPSAVKYLKKDDPLYPCTMRGLDQKYLWACFYQFPGTGKITAENVVPDFEACRKAPPEWEKACAEGLGMGIGSRVTRNLERIAELCRQGSELKNSCLRGALGSMTLWPKPREKMQKFCQLITPEERPVCVEFLP